MVPKSRHSDAAARGAPGGFTLLEVMIALAILSVSLVALAGINSGAINMHSYSKRLTVATLLARGKMADLEQLLQSEGLPLDDDVEEGDFEEEGYPQYRWQAQIIRPKTEEINVANLMAMTGTGLTGGEAGSDPLASLGALGEKFIGDKAPDLSALTGAAGGEAGAAGGLGGMLGGAMQGQLQAMIDDLGKSMREVRLTVAWGEGEHIDQFTITTHVVSLGAGTDQTQSDVAAQAAAAAAASAATPNGGPNLPIIPNGVSSGRGKGMRSSGGRGAGALPGFMKKLGGGK